MFTRAYGDAIERFFDPLQYFLTYSERPGDHDASGPSIMLLVGGIACPGSRSLKIVVGSLVGLFVIGLFVMWTDTMKTRSP